MIQLVWRTVRFTRGRAVALAAGLLVCGLFLAGAALAGVRGRRTEIGALSAMGWSRPQLGRLLATESVLTAVLGSVAGGLPDWRSRRTRSGCLGWWCRSPPPPRRAVPPSR